MTDQRRFNDLIRLGTYAQLEGSMGYHHGTAQFTFFLNQIKGMEELCERVNGKPLKNHGQYVRIYSKELGDSLQGMGFRNFTHEAWNIPNINSFGEKGKMEYLRAVIDSIGNVDVDGYTPYVRLSTINPVSGKGLTNIFGGSFMGPYQTNWKDRYNVQWKGEKALELLDKLDYFFYNWRNSRGSELIKNVRWEEHR